MGIGAFFDGFNRGYETTGRVLRDAELSRISRAAPEEIVTPVETMQGFEGAAPDATGATSQMDLADAPMVQQKTGFRLLGQTYNQAPSEAAIANARMRAMADAISRDDPAQGLRLRQQVTQSERDDERFGMERQRFQREGQEGDLRLAGLRRADAQGQRIETVQAARDRAARWSPEEVERYANQANVNGNVPLFHEGVDPKTGYSVLKLIDPKTGAKSGQIALSPTQMRQAALGAYLLDQGFGAEGMAELQSASKELAEHIMRNNSMTVQAVGVNNTARRMGNQDANDLARLGIDRQRLGLERDRAERGNWATEQYVDKDGNVRTYDVNRSNPKTPQIVERQMPTGLRPYTPRDTGLKVNQDGSVVRDGRLYIPDPKNPGRYTMAQGIDPATDPVAILAKRLGEGGAGGSTLTPFTAADIAAERKAEQLGDYVKQPKRGLFAGRSDYEYVNPATGDKITPLEYQRLDQLRTQREEMLRMRGAAQ